MHIGYVLNENQELSELGKSYLEELRKYAREYPKVCVNLQTDVR